MGGALHARRRRAAGTSAAPRRRRAGCERDRRRCHRRRRERPLARADGRAEPDLDGCFDVDLEASACTNTLPIHRLALLGVGEEAAAPAVYVRVTDLQSDRLEQTYRRLEPQDERPRYHYRSSTFDFECVLVLDEHDLPVDYPGIATRIA